VYILENTRSFLYLNDNYIVGAKKVNFVTYTEDEDILGRSTIIGVDSHENVPIYAIPTSFNILQNRTLLLQEMIWSNPEIDITEKNILLSVDTIVAFHSSGCSFTNIDFSSEYTEAFSSYNFFRAIQVEEKEFRLVNSDINSAGMFFITYDVLNSHFENIRLDWSEMTNGIVIFPTCPEHPETMTHAYLNNVTLFYTGNIKQAYVDLGYLFITGPSISMHNITSQVYAEISNPFYPVFIIEYDTCLPLNQGYQPIVNVTNIHFSMNEEIRRRSKEVYQNFRCSTKLSDPEIKKEIYLTNITFNEITSQNFPLIFLEYDIPTNVTIVNLTFNDTIVYQSLFYIENINVLTLKNVELVNWEINEKSPFSFTDVNRVVLENFSIDGLVSSEISSSFMNIEFLESFYGFDITLKNSNLNHMLSFMSLNSETEEKSVLKNVILLNVTFNDASVFSVQKIVNLITENVFAKNVNRVRSYDVDFALFDFQDLSSMKDSNITIRNITVIESNIEIMKVQSSSQSKDINQYLKMTNINIMNWYYELSRNLIEIFNVESNSIFEIVFEDFTFNNITFPRKGNLFYLQHQLATPVQLKNVSFSNIFKGILIFESFDRRTIERNTKVEATNITMINISQGLHSFFSWELGWEFDVFNSEFSLVNILADGAIFYSSENAKIRIYYSTFFNNTFVEGAVLSSENDGEIEAHNWEFINNFSIRGAVVKSSEWWELFHVFLQLNF
jgi:hypothetical protein